MEFDTPSDRGCPPPIYSSSPLRVCSLNCWPSPRRLAAQSRSQCGQRMTTNEWSSKLHRMAALLRQSISSSPLRVCSLNCWPSLRRLAARSRTQCSQRMTANKWSSTLRRMAALRRQSLQQQPSLGLLSKLLADSSSARGTKPH